MNQRTFDIIDNKIKFSRSSIIRAIKYNINHSNINRTPEEKTLLFQTLLSKIEIFEKKLSDRFEIYLKYDNDIDDQYITEIMQEMQQKVNYFIYVCTLQEYNLSTH